MCFPSRIFQDGGTKACIVPISCQLTQSYVPMDKTHGSSFPSQDHLKMSSRKTYLDLELAPSSRFFHLSVVCNDISYSYLDLELAPSSRFFHLSVVRTGNDMRYCVLYQDKHLYRDMHRIMRNDVSLQP